jgi:hypothetical protein
LSEKRAGRFAAPETAIATAERVNRGGIGISLPTESYD